MPPRPSVSEENYALLPDEDRESLELQNKNEPQSSQPRWRKPAEGRSSALTWVLALLVIVAATDGIAVLYMSRIMDTVYADLSTTDLEFANPYHGLAELYASGTINASHIDPILNLPRLVTQVSSAHPNQPAPAGAHDYWHPSFGTLSPHEHRLRVAPGVRTVAQFRALDFGMERCEVVLRLPGPGDPVESKERPQFSERTVLDVFMLDAQRPLDARKVTWDARPPRRAGERVMTIAPRLGEETRVGQFPCAWGSLHTFEVACAESAGSACLVDVWSSQNTTYGIYMYQHQTI